MEGALKTCIAVALLLFGGVCLAQVSPDWRPQIHAAYPESEAAAAWRALAASYVRKALKDQTLDKDPALNARVDTVMAAVGAAVAAIDLRFANSSWRAILIEDFGHGAAAFPGETILVDAKFVRTLQLNDDELALIFSHEAAHVVAGHASAKLSVHGRISRERKGPHRAHGPYRVSCQRIPTPRSFNPRRGCRSARRTRSGRPFFFRPDMIRNGLWACSTSWRNWRPARTVGSRTPTMLQVCANRLLPE